MYGRYGTDELNLVLMILGIIVMFLSRTLYLCAVPYVLAQHPRAAKRILFFLKGMDTGAKMV